MIHFLTVHWKTDFWIDIQLRYLRRFVAQPFAVHACLTGVDPAAQSHKFARTLTTDIESHPAKLGMLADAVCAEAAAGDVLVFIDSDAFPVADLTPILAGLKQFPLVAIRRDENLGDIQPHPCFCATTVGFWQQISGDWGDEHGWKNANGDMVRDTGGNLLKILSERNIEWRPLLRSNETNHHPLLFGLYENTIYHHAAGSRWMITRRDIEIARREDPHANDQVFQAQLDSIARHNKELSDAILADITADADFLRWFRPSPR